MSGAANEQLLPWPRAWLFTPAGDERKLAAAERSQADALIADLEDAVPPAGKAAAREAAVEFASRHARPPRIVRINDPRGEHGRADLEALRGTPPLAVMVPKAEIASLQLVGQLGIPAVALLETSRGVAEAEQVATMPGVIALALGVVDLASELGLAELPDGLELLHVRSRIVLAAALGAIPAIDGPHVRVDDRSGLELESRRARALGFSAKLCIHPAQLEIVRSAFTPSAHELAWARRVLDAYERVGGDGRGAALVDGEMIDLATVRRARRVLEGAELADEP